MTPSSMSFLICLLDFSSPNKFYSNFISCWLFHVHSSSVAVRRYDGLRAIKFFGCKELLLHFVHLNGLSPVWVASCALGRVNWQKKFLGGPNSTYGSKKCPQKAKKSWPKFGPLSFWVICSGPN